MAETLSLQRAIEVASELYPTIGGQQNRFATSSPLFSDGEGVEAQADKELRSSSATAVTMLILERCR